MPSFSIVTNVPIEEIPTDSTKEFQDVLAQALNKESSDLVEKTVAYVYGLDDGGFPTWRSFVAPYPPDTVAMKISILIQSVENITFDGTKPVAFCDLHFGNVTLEKNRILAKVLTEKMTELLNIPADRIMINFMEGTPETVAVNGTTIADFRAQQAQ